MPAYMLFQTARSRIGGIFILYFFYVVAFFGIGPNSGGMLLQIAADIVAFFILREVIRLAEGPSRTFFLLLFLSFLFDFFSIIMLQLDATFGINYTLHLDKALNFFGPEQAQDPNCVHIDSDGEATPCGDITIDWIFYVIELVFWSCAWFACVLHLSANLRGGNMFLALAPILIICVSLLYYYQLDAEDFVFSHAVDRFAFIALILGMISIQLGFITILMGLGLPFVLMISGFTLGLANEVIDVWARISAMPAELATSPAAAAAFETPEFVNFYNDGGLDPAWVLTKVIMLAGLFLLPRAGEAGYPGETINYLELKRDHSVLSGLLLIFWVVTLSAGLLAFKFLFDQPHWLTMFIILFALVCIIAISRITTRLDEAVSYITDWLDDLFSNKLKEDKSLVTSRWMKTWLSITALDRIMNHCRHAAKRLLDDVIFLGPEKLNRPSVASSDDGETVCFLVMPFSMDWSQEVTENIRSVCKKIGVHSIRGDDLFLPTDILDDIWRGITQADFIIAEITGKNANVYYELGMAHAIGKPVLLLAQRGSDIPFDLRSRRRLEYDLAEPEVFRSNLETAIREVITNYDLGGKNIVA